MWALREEEKIPDVTAWQDQNPQEQEVQKTKEIQACDRREVYMTQPF